MGEPQGYVALTPDGNGLVYGGEDPEGVRRLIEDMRSQWLHSRVPLAKFIANLPTFLNSYTTATPLD
jgi:hypothetical protein